MRVGSNWHGFQSLRPCFAIVLSKLWPTLFETGGKRFTGHLEINVDSVTAGKRLMAEMLTKEKLDRHRWSSLLKSVPMTSFSGSPLASWETKKQLSLKKFFAAAKRRKLRS